MNRVATVSYTKVVTRCRECPFLHNDPYEADCAKLYEMDKKDPYAAIIGNRDIIDPRCPLPFSEDK